MMPESPKHNPPGTPREAALTVWQRQSPDTTAMLQSVAAALLHVAATMPHEDWCGSGHALCCGRECDCNVSFVRSHALSVTV